ncbi:hypothetical protein D3C78_1356230 [compost metagenome]
MQHLDQVVDVEGHDDRDVTAGLELCQVDAGAGCETFDRETDLCGFQVAQDAMGAGHFDAGPLQLFVSIEALQAEEIPIGIVERDGGEFTVTVTHFQHFEA